MAESKTDEEVLEEHERALEEFGFSSATAAVTRAAVDARMRPRLPALPEGMVWKMGPACGRPMRFEFVHGGVSVQTETMEEMWEYLLASGTVKELSGQLPLLKGVTGG